MAAPILWAPGKMRSFCRKKNHAHKIPGFGGGYVGFWGGKCQFYFYGRGDFSEKNHDLLNHASACVTPAMFVSFVIFTGSVSRRCSAPLPCEIFRANFSPLLSIFPRISWTVSQAPDFSQV